MIVIANIFPKLQTVKSLVRTLSKKRRFRTRFDRQDLKATQIFRNLLDSDFIKCFHHCH